MDSDKKGAGGQTGQRVNGYGFLFLVCLEDLAALFCSCERLEHSIAIILYGYTARMHAYRLRCVAVHPLNCLLSEQAEEHC